MYKIVIAPKYIVLLYVLFFISCSAHSRHDLHNAFLKNEQFKSINFTLTPTDKKKIAADNFIVFNIPFPPSYLFKPENISLSTTTGEKLYFYPESTSKWNYIDNSQPSSIRSLKIFLKKDFSISYPLKLKASKKSESKFILNEKPSTPDKIITENINLEFENGIQSISIFEPKVYATFSPMWLSACLFRTKTLAKNKNSALQWFDQASLDFSETISLALDSESLAYNEIALTKHRSWQYDLAATLYNSYIKTGELKWLRQAHKATQIYAHFLNSNGVWTLKKKPDLKFSYNLSMFIDYLLLGDEELLPKIESVAMFAKNWRSDYKRSYGFWTERHQTYSLLGTIIAWEASANIKYSSRAKLIAKASINESLNPEPPWEAQGCLQHEFGDHDRGEGGESVIPVCSPWMSGLLADAMLRYFTQSGDAQALDFLYDLAGFTINHGLYIANNKKNKGQTIPRYLASAEKNLDIGGGVSNDKQHACDVAALLGKGLWAGQLLNKKTTHIKSTIDKLLIPCKDDLNRNHVKSADSGYMYWRSKPPRKYSWLFGTTSDLSFFYTF